MLSTRTKSILASLVVSISILITTPCFAQDAAPVEAAAEAAPVYLVSDLMKKYNINFTGNVTLDYVTSYLWRGQALDRDSVVQPGVNLNLGPLSAGYWGNWDVNNNDSLNSGESDYYVALTHAITDYVTVGIGHTWYGFPGSHTNSREVFASITLPKLPLTPVIGYAHDYDEGKMNLLTGERTGASNYYSLTLSQSIPLLPKYGTSLELGSIFGYVDNQWLAGRGWHITPSAGLKIALASNITIQPTFGYNFPLEDLKDPLIGNQKRKFFSAVKTVYSF